MPDRLTPDWCLQQGFMEFDLKPYLPDVPENLRFKRRAFSKTFQCGPPDVQIEVQFIYDERPDPAVVGIVRRYDIFGPQRLWMPPSCTNTEFVESMLEAFSKADTAYQAEKGLSERVPAG